MKTYRVLVVGCGSIGQRHARLLSERPEVEVFTADPLEANRSACAKVARIVKAYESLEAALRDGMDAVFVCTPNHLHVPQATAALDAGAFVMVEKPVADTSTEAANLAKHPRSGRVAVGYANRFDKLLREVKRLVTEGELGTLLYASAAVYSYFTLLCAKTPFREHQEWVLVADYSHEIDFLRYLAGDVSTVAAMAGSLGNLEHMAKPNLVEAVLGFTSGAIGRLHIDYVRHPEKRFLELVGERGSVELHMTRGILRIYRTGQEGFHEIAKPYVRDDLFRDQIDDVLRMMSSGGTHRPLNTLTDGIAALKVAEAVREATTTQRTVRITDL